jgi:transposase
MRVIRVELTQTERELLQNLIKKGCDWRERERAEPMLLLAEGHTTCEVAEKQAVLPETIREWRRKWFKAGFASLPDQPRRGTPSKWNDEHRARLKAWIEAEPLTCRVLVDRLETECGLRLSANTLRNELKRLGVVWKRTRYSLKKARPRALRTSPTRYSRSYCPSTNRRDRTGLCRRSRVCPAPPESVGMDQKRRNPCHHGETGATTECDRSPAIIGKTGDGKAVAEHQWVMVLCLLDGHAEKDQQALGGDLGQCVHPHRQKTGTLLGSLERKRHAFLFLATVQSRAEPD